MEHFCCFGTFFGGISVVCSQNELILLFFRDIQPFSAVFLEMERNIFHAPQSNTKGGMEKPVNRCWQCIFEVSPCPAQHRVLTGR